MSKGTTRLDTNSINYTGPEERVIGDHPIEDVESGVITPDGELAIDGGKLAGRHDDFDGTEMAHTHGHGSPVPGAKGAGEDPAEGAEGNLPQTPWPGEKSDGSSLGEDLDANPHRDEA